MNSPFFAPSSHPFSVQLPYHFYLLLLFAMPGLATPPAPQIRPWKAPAETKEPVEYADLFTIDLSLYDSPNPEDQKKLLEDFSQFCFASP